MAELSDEYLSLKQARAGVELIYLRIWTPEDLLRYVYHRAWEDAMSYADEGAPAPPKHYEDDLMDDLFAEGAN